MECSVTALRLKGLRLKESEWPAAVVGQLVVDDWDGQANNFRRHLRKAELWMHIETTSRRPILTMYDPVVMKTVRGGFLLSGTELDGQKVDGEHRLFEHQQLWLVIPTDGSTKGF